MVNDNIKNIKLIIEAIDSKNENEISRLLKLYAEDISRIR